MVRLRRTLVAAHPNTVLGFNPTMVRLRLLLQIGYISNFRRFNPTMVRLRLGTAMRPLWRMIQFQSHYGAIATQSNPAPLRDSAPVSIPLWCDCDTQELTLKPGIYKRFNPTMVRLRRRGTQHFGGAKYGFNPTMVRLRPAPLKWWGIESPFQSHYGAIAT